MLTFKGARMAIKMRYISREEVEILKKCLLSNVAAIDIGRQLGYSGTQEEANVRLFKQRYQQLRLTLRGQIQRWSHAVRYDDRFRIPTLARAAATWQRHRHMIENGNGNVDVNVDPFLFDFVIEFGDTKLGNQRSACPIRIRYGSPGTGTQLAMPLTMARSYVEMFTPLSSNKQT